MQIKEINNEGLKREYEVTISSELVKKKYEEELEKVRLGMKLPGFRPGKVTKSIAQSQYDGAIRNKLLEDFSEESIMKLTKDNNIELAVQPKLDIDSFDPTLDLKYKLSVEILPKISIPELGEIKLKKLVADITDIDIDEALAKIAKSRPVFNDAEDDKKATIGDAVVMNFEGKINDVAFPDGKAENFRLVLGSGMFIPGFEEQLIGLKKNDTAIVKVKFPENYHVVSLSNQDAEFDVTIKQILNVTSPEVNDEFAKELGIENLIELKNNVKDKLRSDSESFAKNKMRKKLFDALEEKCDFLIPESLMQREFDILWDEYLKSDEKDSSKTEDEMKKIYNDLAIRRIKLGILITEIAKIDKIEVDQDDIKSAIFEQARQYPGQEHSIMDYYRNNPRALEMLKGPLLENKVVNFIFDKISYDEEKLSLKDLIELSNKEEDQD